MIFFKLITHESPELRDVNFTKKKKKEPGQEEPDQVEGRKRCWGTESLSAAWLDLASWTKQRQQSLTEP